MKLNCNPLDKMEVSSKFGMRTHPITNKPNFHNGIDLKGSTGISCYAVASGKVLISKFHTGLGNYLVIQHNGFLTLYAHLSKLGKAVGSVVLAGDIVGYLGTTGASTGPHLHFEVRKGNYGTDKTFWGMVNGKYPNAVDPEPLILIEEEYVKVLREKTSNPQGWIAFIEKNKTDPVGKYLPELIAKINGGRK